LLIFSFETPYLPHPHPDPPLEREGIKRFLSLRERIKVRVGLIFIFHC